MQTELEERATLVALRAARGPVKADARSLATRASVQAAKVFMISVGCVVVDGLSLHGAEVQAHNRGWKACF